MTEAAIAYPSIPQTYAVRQLGGMACEWSNGVTSHATTGVSPNYRGIQITYLLTHPPSRSSRPVGGSPPYLPRCLSTAWDGWRVGRV